MEIVEQKDLKDHLGKFIVLNIDEIFVAKVINVREENNQLIYSQKTGSKKGNTSWINYSIEGASVTLFDTQEEAIKTIQH